MRKPFGLIAMALLAAALAASALLAGEVGTSKSFRGPVGLVSPYSLRGLQAAKGLAAALDKTRDFGFRYVEGGSDFGGLKPAAFKAELDRPGADRERPGRLAQGAPRGPRGGSEVLPH
jgi:hypothetical protein